MPLYIHHDCALFPPSTSKSSHPSSATEPFTHIPLFILHTFLKIMIIRNPTLKTFHGSNVWDKTSAFQAPRVWFQKRHSQQLLASVGNVWEITVAMADGRPQHRQKGYSERGGFWQLALKSIVPYTPFITECKVHIKKQNSYDGNTPKRNPVIKLLLYNYLV